jgi:hypothetical protein
MYQYALGVFFYEDDLLPVRNLFYSLGLQGRELDGNCNLKMVLVLMSLGGTVFTCHNSLHVLVVHHCED